MPQKRPSKLLKILNQNKYLLLLLLPWVVYYFIFDYIPLFGSIIAFKNYSPFKGALGSPWASDHGLRHFIDFVHHPDFFKLMRNTFLISFYTLLFVKPLSILFALLLNELRLKKYRGFIQTITYIPHFISTTVICGIAAIMLSPEGGIVNHVLMDGLHVISKPIYFLGLPEYFRSIYVGTHLWQHLGFSAIVYISAMTAINPELYDAADIDSANRWQKARFITLPLLMPTIITLLILDLGKLFDVGSEKIVLLYNALTYETADTLSTFVYRVGLQSGQFSLGAATDVFNGMLGIVLVIFSNWLAKRFTSHSLW